MNLFITTFNLEQVSSYLSCLFVCQCSPPSPTVEFSTCRALQHMHPKLLPPSLSLPPCTLPPHTQPQHQGGEIPRPHDVSGTFLLYVASPRKLPRNMSRPFICPVLPQDIRAIHSCLNCVLHFCPHNMLCNSLHFYLTTIVAHMILIRLG